MTKNWTFAPWSSSARRRRTRKKRTSRSLIELPDVGTVRVDVAFGGNFFALVQAEALGVTVHPDQRARLITLGMQVKRAINATLPVRHPTIPHITTVELTEICDQPVPSRPLVRNVVIYGHGHLDRSPCGTGTSAAMAVRHALGELPLGDTYTSESIIGTQFTGALVGEVQLGEFRAVEPVVTGAIYITGIQQFVVDPRDPLKYGFHLENGTSL